MKPAPDVLLDLLNIVSTALSAHSCGLCTDIIHKHTQCQLAWIIVVWMSSDLLRSLSQTAKLCCGQPDSRSMPVQQLRGLVNIKIYKNPKKFGYDTPHLPTHL